MARKASLECFFRMSETLRWYERRTPEMSRAVLDEVLEKWVKMMSPFIPHITEELWERMGEKFSIFHTEWPSFDEKYLKKTKITIVIQINGKVRGKIEGFPGIKEEEVIKKVMEEPRIKKWIEGKEIIKKIFVPDKIMNLVIK